VSAAVVAAADLLGAFSTLPPEVVGELTLQSALDHHLRQLVQQTALTGQLSFFDVATDRVIAVSRNGRGPRAVDRDV
jgi:hypothetical protein